MREKLRFLGKDVFGLRGNLKTTIKDAGEFLEVQARIGYPIACSQVIRRFPVR